VRGSVFGVSLNRQVQGSCDPEVTTCDKFYVDDLRQLGKETVRSGSESFDNIPDARNFIQDLRTKFPLPTCESMVRQQDEQVGQPTQPTAPSTPPSTPPRGGGSTASSTPPSESATGTSPEPEEPEPGVNCREPRGDEGGG
jgi:PPM family protein phosphatase